MLCKYIHILNQFEGIPKWPPEHHNDYSSIYGPIRVIFSLLFLWQGRRYPIFPVSEVRKLELMIS